MPVNVPEPTNPPAGDKKKAKRGSQQEPLSGSKKVKNRNHSRSNHGEGS